MSELFFLLMFIVLATAFAITTITAAFLVSYRSENVDQAPYECGMNLFGGAKIQFNIKFLNFAIMFLIFDVEAILLFPFAVNFLSLRLYVLFEVVLFLILMLFILFYAFMKNILRWQ